MSSHTKHNAIRRSSPKSGKSPLSNKPNENSDTIYIVQNENDILKLKNAEMEQKIQFMTTQLTKLSQRLILDQKHCQSIRSSLKFTKITQDLKLQEHKRGVEDKLSLMKGGFDMLVRKLKEAREATDIEQNKLPAIKEEKVGFQKELWDARAQNEGTKIILEDLQAQLQKMKEINENEATKRVDYGPIQRRISSDIEGKIENVKNQQNFADKLKKNKVPKILACIVNLIEKERMKEGLTMIERQSLLKKNMQKRVFLLSLIRKKYLLFVKNYALQVFRTSFRPMEEQKKFMAIIQNTRKRRVKNKMFRVWRSQYVQAQYNLVRRFQVQNQIQKLGNSITKSNIFSAFNKIKHWQRHPIHQRSLQIMDSIHRKVTSRVLNWFMSSFVGAENAYKNSKELDESAKEQSILLTMSAYFTNWAKLTKQNKLSNRILKFKYFRSLKKLIKLKKKRNLSEMLAGTHSKINDVDELSSKYCTLKKKTILSILSELRGDLGEIEGKNKNIQESIRKFTHKKKNQHQELALLKVSKHLKGKMSKAFDIWRVLNRKMNTFKLMFYMLNSKVNAEVNYAFACIQKRKFEKLKVSIAQKIESCEFSYNYLVEENKHIKEVLDTKTLDLEKSKFVTIIRRLIRSEKEMKHKYFHTFMKAGLKFWKFRKVYQKIDKFIEKKIKISFMFMLKFISSEKQLELNIQSFTENMKVKVEKDLLVKGFLGFQHQLKKIRKMKKILKNNSDRNLELNVYNGYNAIKNYYMNSIFSKLDKEKNVIKKKINLKEDNTEGIGKNIEKLRQRLKDKEESIFNRKILACRKFFVRNSSNRALHYFGRWRNKAAYENKVQKFASILQRKSRILLENRFIVNLFKKQGEKELGELKSRYQKYHQQLEGDSKQYEKFLENSQNNSAKMNEENQFHQKEGEVLEKKTQIMDEVKLKTFSKFWNKMMSGFVLREWKKQKDQLKRSFNLMCKIIRSASVRHTFSVISEEVKEKIFKLTIRKNLSRIYSKKFRSNVGMAFKVWRLTGIKSKVEEFQRSYDHESGLYKIVEDRFNGMTTRHLNYVDFRANDRKLRKIVDFMKKYTKRKLENNKRKKTFEGWLLKGYQVEFYRIFEKYTKALLQKCTKADKFKEQKVQKKVVGFFNYLKTTTRRKGKIKRLFIERFVFHQMQKLNEEFFTRVKNYHRFVEVSKKNYKTFCLQKTLQTFEKKRKNILCDNFRKWRRNQFQMRIGKKMFKRLTRKAIMSRYQGMFYTWKVETEAKKVVHHHSEEGEVKKRKSQIGRLQRFIEDYKKKKGLLLENEEGNFVQSPRFQKKKEEAQRKENNMRYKFISRLIMSLNGYNAPIRAFCNMQTYTRLREKYRKSATFVLNHLRKPDLLLPFKTWRKATHELKDKLDNMEKKDLIKLLNRQKDKLEMQYGKKIEMDEKVEKELRRYKVLAHQREKKEKLCVHILMKNADKLKKNAFDVWKKNVNNMRDEEYEELGRKGYKKMNNLEYELKELEETQRQLQQNNQSLREAVNDALDIAEMVKRISEERDKLSMLIRQKDLTCESLLAENQVLNSKLYLAQKQAMNLLIISNQRP